MIIFGTLLIIKLQWNMLCHVVSYACTIFRHFAIFTFNILFLQVDIRSRFGPFCQLELSHMIDKINISGKQRGGRGFATCYVADSRVHLTSVCGKSKYSGRGGERRQNTVIICLNIKSLKKKIIRTRCFINIWFFLKNDRTCSFLRIRSENM